jgi:hypothetical protein
MKIFIRKLKDFKNPIEIDLELILINNEFIKDKLLPIQNFLFQTNRNIFLKIIYDLNKTQYRGKIFTSKTYKEPIIEYYECSFITFQNHEELYIEEYDIKNFFKLENLDENDINFVYINEQTNEQFKLIGKKIDTKLKNNSYNKLKSICDWFINDLHIVTICYDLSCSEYKLFYKDSDSIFYRILFELFDFIEKNYNYLQEFVIYNTSHPFNELSNYLN